MRHPIFTAFALFAITVAFIVTPASARAFMIDLENQHNLSNIGTIYGNEYPNGITGKTGVQSWTIAGYWPEMSLQIPSWGFCIEMPQAVVNGWFAVLSLDQAPHSSDGLPMGSTKANYIRELWGRDFDSAWITGADAQKAEAFSAAIFEIIYETDSSWNVTSGTGFYCTGLEESATDTANTWLSQLNGDTRYFANNLYAVGTYNGQDYVVQTPEPTTLSLFAFGAAALLRKRKS